MSEDDGKAVKKVVLLYPEEKAGDKIALDFIHEGMLKERGRIMRAMLLTGAAMMQANKKLPFMIAELFDENTTITDIQRVIRSAIPDASAVDDDILRNVLSRLSTIPDAIPEDKGSASVPESEPTQKERNAAEARHNAGKLFKDD